jgi:hypothetical protein
VSKVKTDKLDYRQIERLTTGIAESCLFAHDEYLTPALMILMYEISENSDDAETIANLLADKLYTTTRDCNDAQERYVASEREKWMKGGEGR